MTHWLQLEPKVIPQTIAIFDFGRFFVRNLEIMHIFIVIMLIDGHHVYYSWPVALPPPVGAASSTHHG